MKKYLFAALVSLALLAPATSFANDSTTYISGSQSYSYSNGDQSYSYNYSYNEEYTGDNWWSWGWWGW